MNGNKIMPKNRSNLDQGFDLEALLANVAVKKNRIKIKKSNLDQGFDLEALPANVAVLTKNYIRKKIRKKLDQGFDLEAHC